MKRPSRAVAGTMCISVYQKECQERDTFIPEQDVARVSPPASSQLETEPVALREQHKQQQ